MEQKIKNIICITSVFSRNRGKDTMRAVRIAQNNITRSLPRKEKIFPQNT
jgi:hypothetical protein